MKYLTFFLLMVFTTSCLVELKTIYPKETIYGIDFTPYTSKGFLFTPEKYDGQYESIGMITYTTMPGAKYLRSGAKPNPYYRPGGSEPGVISVYEWVVDSMKFSDALRNVYDICVSMGADAMINFQNEVIRDEYTNIKNPVVILGYSISGFAIKRKK